MIDPRTICRDLGAIATELLQGAADFNMGAEHDGAKRIKAANVKLATLLVAVDQRMGPAKLPAIKKRKR